MSLPESTTPQDQARLDKVRAQWDAADQQQQQQQQPTTTATTFPHPRFLLFWGHSSNKTYIDQACLSQWWPATFVDEDGNSYGSAEHYMMAEKAKLFATGEFEEGNKAVLAQILTPNINPAMAKKLGRCVEGFDEAVWGQHRFDIVKRGTYLKFSQNKPLAQYLINTADKIDYFVEASPVDNIWGIGLAASDEESRNPNTWVGLNLLGFALTEVRDRLVAEKEKYMD